MSNPALYGVNLFGDPIEPPSRGKISDDFIVPPFTVLNAREGFWQERKRAWVSMGLRGELGRSGGCGGSAMPAADYQNNARGNGRGEELADGDDQATSIFDPVLTELAYRWFCPPDGLILDPFAGGSVRGIVAACLGRKYIGVDLRPEQLDANRAQAQAICDGNQPEWIEGDSREFNRLAQHAMGDFLFSCPPYGNLEVYSDDPRDISTLDYATFREAYREIIGKSCGRLLDNRFACFVVGDFRDSKGRYQNFVSDTIAAFRDAGLHFYNEAILVTAVGSLPIRVGKQFSASRKLGKTHQNVLVFVKGDGKSAARACGEIKDGAA